MANIDIRIADADEFIVYPGCEEITLPEYAASLERYGYDAACLYMVDMYPDGELSNADFAGQSPFSVARFYDTPPLENWRLSKGYYSDSSHMVSSFRHRIMPYAEPTAYTSKKFALLRYRPWIKLSDGLHFVTNIVVAPEPIAFAHFKYHAGFQQKAAVEAKRKQHYKEAKEYLRYQELSAELKGGFRKQGVSSEYIDSHQFISSILGNCGE